MNEPLAARRPLTSRSSGWAGSLSRTLLKCRVKPNQVSVASIGFAALTAASLACIGHGLPAVLAWALAAVGIQGRLLCNLMDGMLAVEGGLKTPTGDLFNEFPDRIADVLILASIGHAGGTECSTTLGWLAGCGALLTAAVRLQGASLLGTHDFRGPMAKPHRMALATGLCLLMAVLSLTHFSLFNPIPWALGIMLVGIVITVWRRLTKIAGELHQRTSAP